MKPLTLIAAALAASAAALSLPAPAHAGGDTDALTECGLAGAAIGLLWPPGGAAFIAGCIVGYEVDKHTDSADGSFPTFDIKAAVDAAEWGDPCIPGCICVTEPCPCCPLVPWLVLKDNGPITVQGGIWQPDGMKWTAGVQCAKLRVIDIRDIAQMPAGLNIDEWAWGEPIPCFPNSANPGAFSGIFEPAFYAGLSTSYMLRMDLELESGEIETAYVAAGVLCEGDADFDGDVDSADLNLVLAQFGNSTPLAGTQGDVNFDGGIDSDDLNLVLANFGNLCAP